MKNLLPRGAWVGRFLTQKLSFLSCEMQVGRRRTVANFRSPVEKPVIIGEGRVQSDRFQRIGRGWH